MPVTKKVLEALIESELATCADERVIRHVRGMLVEPYVVLLGWDYGEPGQQYSGWMVLDDPHSRAAIAYCEYGFGPRCPWGLVGHQENARHMGMDSGWFTTFLDAFFESAASIELPIWRVFRTEADGTRTPLSAEGGWDETWHRVYALRNADPAHRYDCDHGIKFGQA